MILAGPIDQLDVTNVGDNIRSR
eukprot:SAG11_NODE_35254_length_267_cov_0.928571_1_plen_22_part_10